MTEADADKALADAFNTNTALIQIIEFSAVQFCYPSRVTVKILKGLSLTIHRGQKVALVGESGSGKSTCIQLLERYYDPRSGSVTINGVQLKEIPVFLETADWLRRTGARSLFDYCAQQHTRWRQIDHRKAGNFCCKTSSGI